MVKHFVYELQGIEVADSLNKTITHPTRVLMRKERTNNRRLHYEGVDLSDVFSNKLRKRK